MPPPATSLLDETLAKILTRAYGTGRRQEYDSFSAVFAGVMGGSTLGQIVGGDDEPMATLVGIVFRLVGEEGSAAVAALVEGVFLALPGNRDLREWVSRRRPEILPLVSEADFLAAERGLQAERVSVVSNALDEIQQAKGWSRKIGDLARQDLAVVDENLRRLQVSKDVHDILHRVQTGAYAALWPLLAPGLVLSPEHTSTLASQVRSLKLALVELDIQLAMLDGDRSWIESFRQATDLLDKGADDPAALRTGLFSLRSVLRMQLMLYDHQIVAAADRIPFGGVLKFLRHNAKLEAFSSPTAMQPLESAAHELGNVEQVLRRTLQLHQRWQRVDADLWFLEQELETPDPALSMLKGHWEMLAPTLDGLRDAAPDMWNVNVDQARALVAQALEDTTPGAAVSALRTFVRIGRLQFSSVDKMVLDQCTRIGALRRPIEDLLKEM